MQTFTRLVKVIGIAACLCAAIPAYAESAPVYDADSMVSPYESGSDAQDVPPPSTPEEERSFLVPGGHRVTPSISMSVDQRLRRIEQQISNLQGSDAFKRTESLQDQVQTLRGQVEQLTHQIQEMQKQQKLQYADLDKRLSQPDKSTQASAKLPKDSATSDDTMSASNADSSSSKASDAAKSSSKSSSTKSAADTAAAKPTSNQPDVAEEQQIYQTAYNQIKAKKYNDAVNALQGMLKKYPSGQFAANAHYWLGELYGLMSKNDQALAEFSSVLKTYPDSPRVSDAQLKVGLIYASQLKWTDAKSALKKVINLYPGTTSARLAADQLKQIKLAGH